MADIENAWPRLLVRCDVPFLELPQLPVTHVGVRREQGANVLTQVLRQVVEGVHILRGGRLCLGS